MELVVSAEGDLTLPARAIKLSRAAGNTSGHEGRSHALIVCNSLESENRQVHLHALTPTPAEKVCCQGERVLLATFTGASCDHVMAF